MIPVRTEHCLPERQGGRSGGLFLLPTTLIMLNGLERYF